LLLFESSALPGSLRFLGDETNGRPRGPPYQNKIQGRAAIAKRSINRKQKKENMRAIYTSIKVVAVVLAVSALSATFARADNYSWQNLQSDIPGVAAHTDPNLVNPWGMAANSTGTRIWVSDNGTGVSTIYDLAGNAQSLIVTIPPASKNKNGG